MELKMNQMKFVGMFVFAMAICLPFAPCSAALVIEVDDAMITAGGTATVNVYLNNVDRVGLADVDERLFFVEYSFEIGGGDGVSDLRFLAFDNFPAEPDFGYVASPDYLFNFDETGAVDPIGGDSEYSGDSAIRYFGNELSVRIDPDGDDLDSLIRVGERRLLTQIELAHTLGVGQTADNFAGTTFTITPGQGATFEQADFSEITTQTSLFRTGTFSVAASVAAVPEPSAAFALILGSSAWIARRRRSPRLVA